MSGVEVTSGSQRRLEALRATGLLDSAPEQAFDRFTELVTATLHTPVALVSLIDLDRQFNKSQIGIGGRFGEARQWPLSHSFCRHTVDSGEPLLVADARIDERFRNNPAITDLGVIAYAGVPIRTLDGFVLGSLCAIDGKPRIWTGHDLALLQAMAAMVILEVESRTHSARNAERTVLRDHIDRQWGFFRSTIHDLRTPISAMIMGLDLISRATDLDAEPGRLLEICRRNGKVVLSLVDNLLDLTDVELRGSAALQPSRFQPHELIAQAIEQITTLAESKRIAIETRIDANLPIVSADADKLIRVLVNLLSNAVRYTRRGGRIVVHSDLETEAGRRFIKFAVEDNGVGVAQPDHIFEENFRHHPGAPTDQSTGLGLLFCKRIVEAHGGRIWFDSSLSVGSTFYFTIPLN